MKILGYSERGVLNSLVYNIGDDRQLVADFINLVSIPVKINIDIADDYIILMEQSLSEFGDCDMIIIVKDNELNVTNVLFFEAKVKTYQKNWIMENQYKYYLSKPSKPGHTSNLFSQLELKKLLMEHFDGLSESANDKNGKRRRIGKNLIVSKAHSSFRDAFYRYYIGIVPSGDAEIRVFLNNYFPANDCPYHFVSWSSIEGFCKANNLSKVIDVFHFNKGQIY